MRLMVFKLLSKVHSYLYDIIEHKLHTWLDRTLGSLLNYLGKDYHYNQDLKNSNRLN